MAFNTMDALCALRMRNLNYIKKNLQSKNTQFLKLTIMNTKQNNILKTETV